MPHPHCTRNRQYSQNSIPRQRKGHIPFKLSRNNHRNNVSNLRFQRNNNIQVQPIKSVQVVDIEKNSQKRNALARVFGGTVARIKKEVVDLEKEDNCASPSELLCLDEYYESDEPTAGTEVQEDADTSIQFLGESTSSSNSKNAVQDEDIQVVPEESSPKKPKRRKSRRMESQRQNEDTSSENQERIVVKSTVVHSPQFMDCYSVYMNNRFPNKNLHRRWSQVSTSFENNRYFDFVVCSYNVLCQETIGSTQYLYRHTECNAEWLNWQNRWTIFQQEIPKLDADIFGMQEIQDDHFVDHYQPFMRANGFDGLYKKKFGILRDGCAVFYRKTMFDLVEYVAVDYYVNETTTSNRGNVGQIVVLRSKTTNGLIIVANTHLIFNEERGDVKLAQLIMLFAHLAEVRAKYTSPNFKPSIIILGDFNIEAFSLIYSFITKGKLFAANQNVRTMSGQSQRPGGAQLNYSTLIDQSTKIGLDSRFDKDSTHPNDGSVYHPFGLKSAYVHGNYGKRDISTYHKDLGNPDFIFYTVDEIMRKQLVLTHRYELPHVDHLRSVTPWPNHTVPSDHIPLLARFRLTI